MKDFINKTVFYSRGHNNIYFGRVIEQKMRNDWLWVCVKWEPDSPGLTPWHKITNVGIVDKKKMLKMLKNL
jgi:hypothetical protein